MSFVDIHCHLHFQRIAGCVESILSTARNAGIQRFVVNSTGEVDWEEVRAFAESHKDVVPCYGIHPYQSGVGCSIQTLRKFCSLQKGPYWIGEIGMDKSIVKQVPLETQSVIFEEQVQLAKELNVPFSVHCVKCIQSVYEVLARHGPFSRGFLMHGYAGPPDYVSKLAELGAYFSFSGYLLNLSPNRQKAMRDVIRKIPLDRLLFESDSPDMAIRGEDVQSTVQDDEHRPANTPTCILTVEFEEVVYV